MPFKLAITLNGLDHERAIAAKFCARDEALSILLKRCDSATDTDDSTKGASVRSALTSP